MKKEPTNIFIELISNKNFCDWVNEPSGDNDVFWKKWREEHPEHLEEFMKAKEFLTRLKFKEEFLSNEESDILLRKVLRGVKSDLSGVAGGRKNHETIWLQWLRVAASFFIIFSFYFLIQLFTQSTVEEEPMEVVGEEWRVLNNPRGRKSRVTLPDGTKVILNYESELTFPKNFTAHNRMVKLTGEAFFEVVHIDSLPFTVESGGIITEVLGTSFNINAFEWTNKTDISLVTGKVKIRKPDTDEEEVYLNPGKQLSFNRSTSKSEVKDFDIQNTIAWKEGIIVFKDASITEFIEQLERWYGVHFQVHGTPKTRWNINGRYQNEKLEDILIGLKFVYDLEYQINGKNVTLKIK